MKIVEYEFIRHEKYTSIYCQLDNGTVISADIFNNWRERLADERLADIFNNWRERLGDEYIRTHLTLKKADEDWEINLSWADYHNDLKRNPPRRRKLKWVGFDCARKCDIYEDTREPGRCYYRWEDNGVQWYDFNQADDSVHPNVLFICPEKGICEKIRYDDNLGLIAESAGGTGWQKVK